jgi:hypothetical protein
MQCPAYEYKRALVVNRIHVVDLEGGMHRRLVEDVGNWAINTGNGFYGGLQFLPATWEGFGGGGVLADTITAMKMITPVSTDHDHLR